MSLVEYADDGSSHEVAQGLVVQEATAQLAMATSIEKYPGLEEAGVEGLDQAIYELTSALRDHSNNERVGFSSEFSTHTSSFWYSARVSLPQNLADLLEGSADKSNTAEALVQVGKNNDVTLWAGPSELLDLLLQANAKDEDAEHGGGPDSLSGYRLRGLNVHGLNNYATSMGAVVRIDMPVGGSRNRVNPPSTVYEATKSMTAGPVYKAGRNLTKILHDPILKDRLCIELLSTTTQGVKGEIPAKSLDWSPILQSINLDPKNLQKITELLSASGGAEREGGPLGKPFRYEQNTARMTTPELAFVLEACGIADQEGVHVEASRSTKGDRDYEIIVTPAQWRYQQAQLRIKPTNDARSDFAVECLPFPTPTAQANMQEHAARLKRDIENNDSLAFTVYAQLAHYLIQAEQDELQRELPTEV